MGLVQEAITFLSNPTIAIILLIVGIVHLTGMLNFFKNAKQGKTAGLIITIIFGLMVLGPSIGLDVLSAGGPAPTGPPTLAAAQCADDKDTSLTLQVHNAANLTGDELYDATVSIFRVESSGQMTKVLELADTTAPTASTIDCGFEYVAKVQATDAASGDNSRIKTILSGAATINSDGDLRFAADKSNVAIDVGIEQQATLECRAFSVFDNAFMFDTGDASATDFETDGVTWTSIADNATAYSEANGVELTFNCRAIQSDTNWNDKGVYFLVEAPTATWQTPTVRVNGETLSDKKGDSQVFSINEQKAWSGYEYVYFKDVDVYDAGDGMEISWVQQLQSGVASSSADPEFDIAVRGNYEAINGIDVRAGGAKDDSSATVVRSVYDMTLDVT